MELRKKRWLILAASCLVNLSIGIMYAWSVFAAPMAERLNALNGFTGAAALSASDLAVVFAAAKTVSPIMMITGGVINDRVGPKGAIFAGGLLFGGGMIASAFVTSLNMLVLCCGVIVELGASLAYGCVIGNSVKFFPDRRGLVGGITVAVFGLSSVIVSPLATALIAARGVDQTLFLLGLAVLLIVSLCSFLIQRCPPGYQPTGWQPPQDGAQGQELNWRQMLRQPIFYVMLLILCCGSIFGLMIISQAAPIARQMVGMNALEAAAVVSILALCNALGRIACGYISDRIGRINMLSAALLAAIAALAVLYTVQSGQVVKLYLCICVLGFCFGGVLAVFPGFTADRFGGRNNSLNYGIMFTGYSLGAVIGPNLLSRIYNSSGTYQPAFLLAAAAALCGLVLTAVYRYLSRKATARQTGL